MVPLCLGVDGFDITIECESDQTEIIQGPAPVETEFPVSQPVSVKIAIEETAE